MSPVALVVTIEIVRQPVVLVPIGVVEDVRSNQCENQK